MARRRLVLLTAPVLALGAAIAWHFTRPEPVITWQRARLIQAGRNRSEVNALLGGPAGDYTGGAVVSYVRGSVGASLFNCLGRQVHAVYVIAKRGKVNGVLAGTAPDVEYLASHPPLLFQGDDGRLWLADHPGSRASRVGLVEHRQRRGRLLCSESHYPTIEAQVRFRSR